MSDEPRERAPGASDGPSSGSERSAEGEKPRPKGETPASASSSSSGDELSALLGESLVEPHPDPFLGEFSQEARPSPPSPVADMSEPPSSESFDAVSALIAFTDSNQIRPVTDNPGEGTDSTPSVPRTAAPGSSGSFEALPALTPLGDSPSSVEIRVPEQAVDPRVPEPSSVEAFSALDLSTPPRAKETPSASDDDDDDEDEDDLVPRGRPWLTLLLVSYSSAVTLGLVWVLLSGRRLHPSESGDDFPAVDARPDPGRRADQSRRMVPPPPLIAEHTTTLGRPVRIGSVEATPLEIVQGPVALERAFGEGETRDGGAGALKLKIRLKNVSTELIFAPLDEAFLRETDSRERDSFIETSRTSQIAMYPLAVASEWSIVGQTFRELRPDESFETVVVSAPDVADRLVDEMTWRIRLRTGIDQTDTLGVRFSRSEIQPAP